MREKTIKVYPTSWLMTAGIVGFMRIFDGEEFYRVNDSELEILDFDSLKERFFERYFQKARGLMPLNYFYHNSRVSTNNMFKKNGEPDIEATTRYFFDDIRDTEFLCSFCNERNAIERRRDIDSNNVYHPVYLDESHFTPLAGSPDRFRNLYWQGNPSNFLCLPCELVLYCAAFGFTKAYDRYVFINAPATLGEIMEINRIWAEYLTPKADHTFKASMIEILKKMDEFKARWALQNISFIELVPLTKTTFNIFHFSIPPEVASAIRKMIPRYPDSLKDVYDIFVDCIYAGRDLYDMVSNILYGYIHKERLKAIDSSDLKGYPAGRMVMLGRGLKNTADLLFFLRFQREVENMNSEIIDRAFKEGQMIRRILYSIQGDDASRTVERFSYRFLEALRRRDGGDLVSGLIRLYYTLDQRRIPEFFKELLKDPGSMSQVGYAFLLGLNAYGGEPAGSSTQTEKEV